MACDRSMGVRDHGLAEALVKTEIRVRRSSTASRGQPATIRIGSKAALMQRTSERSTPKRVCLSPSSTLIGKPH